MKVQPLSNGATACVTQLTREPVVATTLDFQSEPPYDVYFGRAYQQQRCIISHYSLRASKYTGEK